MIHPEKKGRHWVPLLIMAVLALCCTALFYAVPMVEDAPAHPAIQEMPWFSLENGILYFDETKYTGNSLLTVPSTADGAAVTALGDGCFRDCVELSGIILPETLEAIGEEAFQNCTALRGIEIPDSVVFIGKSAFDGCSNLEAICISEQLQHIGANAFDGCTSLHYVYFLGKFQDWSALYRGFIDPTVVISCEDGKFYQNGDPA